MAGLERSVRVGFARVAARGSIAVPAVFVCLSAAATLVADDVSVLLVDFVTICRAGLCAACAYTFFTCDETVLAPYDESAPVLRCALAYG